MSRLFSTCPHCFQKINLAKAVFRCREDNCKARAPVSIDVNGTWQKFGAGDTIPTQKDALLESVWDIKERQRHIFRTWGLVPPVPKLGRVRYLARCPASKAPTTDRLCPKCHKSLYTGIGKGSEKRFTLIGAKDTGKSSYIAVLINELATTVGSKFGFALPGVDDCTRQRYDGHYYKPVFIEKTRLVGTDDVRSRADSIAPLVFGLRFNDRDRDATLSLFDPPGEGVILGEKVERFHHFVFNSHGLVLLIDGAKLASEKDSLDVFMEANEVLAVAAQQVEAQRSLWSANTRPFVAITVSKADCLRQFDDLPSTAWLNPKMESGYDEQDFRVMSSEVETLLRRRGGVALCNTAQKTFGADRVAFFLVSAFGCTPNQSTGKIDDFNPMRVSDPFLWLFRKTGVLPSDEART